MDSNINRVIGERIRSLRIKKGWTQNFVAEKLNITREYLSNLERGTRRWNLELLIKVSELFEISPSLLLDPNISLDNIVELSEVIQYLSKLDKEKIYRVRKIAELVK